jgi:uncharacterized protein (TIGR00661 family)
MKILYGVQGTGNGHISRARVMAKHFEQKGIDVDYLFSGRQKKDYFDMEQFGHVSTPKYKQGLTFKVNSGKIDQFSTFRHLHFREFWRDAKNLDLHGYDLVISDFEPISAWAAKWQKVPSLGIGHQYAFLWDIPLAGHNFFTHNIMRYFAPVTHPVGLHWHHFNQPILPPIIDTSLVTSPTTTRKILVYLPFEEQSVLRDMLGKIPDTEFYLYGQTGMNIDEGNIHIRKPSLLGFKQDLKEAGAVISNAGFELVSECIHLGKSMLIKPLSGQMEQKSNAKALHELGLASVMHQLEQKVIEQWLTLEEQMPNNPIPDVADKLTDWIIDGKWRKPDNLIELSNALWQQMTEG